MKQIFRLSWSMIVAVMSWGMFACGSDDDIAPEISIPSGNEDFFAKSMDFGASAAEKALTFSSNVAWKLSVADNRDGSNWLSVNPTSGEAGTHTVTVKVLENKSYDDRNAVITIAAGDSIRKVFVNQKQLDALTLTSNRFDVPVEGGSINIEINANIEYEVTIPDEYRTWIHKVNSKTRALTTSTVSFTIDKCEEYDKREGKIVVKGKDKEETITVYQVGKGILTLTQNNYNISSAAQELSIHISSNFDYAVEMPNVEWLKEVTDKTRGISTHTLILSVAENKSYDGRSAKLRVFDRNSDISEEVIINQSQKNELSIDKKEHEFDENGGSFSVETNSNVDYKVSINCSWITETTGKTRGLTKSIHYFNVSAISDDSDREGVITFIDSKTGISEKVQVKQKRTIFFDNNSLSIMEGSEKKISLTNRTNQEITWSSSNPSIASVDSKGNVKAVSKGKTTITATTMDGLHICKCEITVQNITDCVSILRTAWSSYISPWGSAYSVTYTIRNSSQETIHIISLGGVTEGVTRDLKGGESVEISLSSRSELLIDSKQKLIFKFKDKEYSIEG